MRTQEVVDVFSVSLGLAEHLGELPSLSDLRAQLRSLPEGASPRDRARLHLTAAIVMQDRREGGTLSALEEARQAMELLSAEGGPALAAAEHHFGRIALVLAVGDPAEPPDVARLVEARRFLELARADFEARNDVEALALSAAELAFVAERERNIAAAFSLLDAELARATPTTRGILRVCKITLGLGAPAFRDEADAAAAAFLREDARTDADEREVRMLVGIYHGQLSPETRRLALAWLEGRPKPPLHPIIVLRSSLAPKAPETWIRSDEKASLLALLTDPGVRADERWSTAHLLLANLADTERELRLRCAEILEEAVVSPDVHPSQRTVYRHDVGVAYLALARDDRRLVARAVEYLAAVVEHVHEWERADVMANLASAQAALLQIDAAVSSPALLDHVRRLEAVLALLPLGAKAGARNLRVVAASALLRWNVFTHPACLTEARRILRDVLSEDPSDGEALRFAYLATWCAHVQGRAAASAVEAARTAAEQAGPVPETRLEPPPGESRDSFARLVGVLAGTEPPSSVKASSLGMVARIRPDAADLLLDVAEERARLHNNEYSDDLLETLAEALRLAPGGDAATRARRMSALLLSAAPRLADAQRRRILGSLRGPIGVEVEKALGASNMAFGDPAPEGEPAGRADRAQAIQGRALELFDKAGECHDTREKVRLLEEARGLLDEAMKVVRPLPSEHRAVVQISAGNARRRLAELQPERAPLLLDEAIALYREAYPWTAPDSDDRGRLSKVFAQALIQRGIAADWEEARGLFSEALGVRKAGQLRAETLMAVIEAELAHPSRSRAASVAAALDAACEAIENLDPRGESVRISLGGRAVSLLAELVRSEGVTPEAADRLARRIAASCPPLLERAQLASLGFAEGALREEEIRPYLESEFMHALVESSDIARPPLADRAMPPELAHLLPPEPPNERLRRNDAAALRQEEDRWRAESRSATGERRAGYLVGVARVVARRVDLGDAPPALLEAAFADAQASVAEIGDLEVRAFASSDLAVVWSDHHAACDFARSARLLEESLRLYKEGGSKASTDTLQYLARATRFREDLPFGQRLKDAIRMYDEAASEYRARGDAGGYLVCMLNMAEAMSLREDRPRATALQEAMEVERLALHIARLRGDRPHTAMLLAAMAWGFTQLAADPAVPAAERERCHDLAGPLFEEAETLTEDPERLRNVRNNHLHWMEMRDGSQSSVIAGRRSQLASIDRLTHPHDWSFAAHNLAEVLIYPGASAAEIKEALSLYRDALAARPIDAAPELHWECAHQIGALLGGQRYPGRVPTLRDLGISPEHAYREASLALRSAMDAGRRLGLGSKLVTAARTMGLVATSPPGHLACDVASAHEALETLADVLRIAPDDVAAADAEAEVARALLLATAKQRASGAPRAGRHALLAGTAAWDLVHLVLRARGGRHRRLRMRMSRPGGVDPATWTRWRRVLRERHNDAERRAAAEDVQREAPEFLTRAASLEATLAWLAAGPGRAAASLVMTDDVMLLIALHVGDSGPTPSAVITELRACPVAVNDTTEVLRSAVDQRRSDHAAAVAKAAELRAWLVESVVTALKQVLPGETAELCWSPNGIAAWMPLEVLWPDGPRVWTTPCLTRPPPAADATRQGSVLLVCADPCAPDDPGSLPEAALLVPRLVGSSTAARRTEVLAGAGRAYGHSLLPASGRETVADRPPSRAEVLARAQGCRLLLVLAHGTYVADDPAKSHLQLIDADGKDTLLTAEDISERPELLRDTVVVLLSCESGAGGRLDAGPAGLAGALLSVGAQVVIAPLWLVFLGTAVNVGRAVVDHLFGGGSVESLPGAVRAARQALDAAHGEDSLLNAPFVVWCG